MIIFKFNEFIKESLNQLNKITLEEAIKLSQIDDIKEVVNWLKKDINDIEFYYKEEPIEFFKSQINDMISM